MHGVGVLHGRSCVGSPRRAKRGQPAHKGLGAKQWLPQKSEQPLNRAADTTAHKEVTMVWVIILVGAVTSAVIAANKGRNVLGWCLLGACLPLISIIAVACLPAADASQASPTVGDGT
jgi:hypothetical protein